MGVLPIILKETESDPKSLIKTYKPDSYLDFSTNIPVMLEERGIWTQVSF